jgi:hypothetical protein
MLPGPRLRFLVAGLIVLACPLAYGATFSGDGVIHLEYAERAAAGHLFEFNAGEVSSGETSPGYMFLLAACFKVFPIRMVPVVVKGVDLAAWYALAIVVWRLARRLLKDTHIADLAAFVAAVIPGSTYNATIGMENGLFALALYIAVLLHVQSNGMSRVGGEIAQGSLWGVALWLRPEGGLAAILWYVLRLMGRPRANLGRWGAGVLTVLCFGVLLVTIQLAWTGTLAPASGRSRLWLASLQSIPLGFFLFDPSLVTRLAMYAPLSAPAFIGTVAVLRHGTSAFAPVWRYLALLFLLFAVLYSFVLGAAHVGRYVIFLMPAVCLLGGLGIERFRERGIVMNRPTKFAAAVALVGVFAAESVARTGLTWSGTLFDAMRAPAMRAVTTDELLKKLGSPSRLPINVAIDDVDVRYAFDDRVTVWPLDGRTDARFFDFVSHDTVDYAAYLRARHVDYLLAFPNFNRDPSAWTPSQLIGLPPNGDVIQAGLRFRRIGGSGAVAILEPSR